MSLSLVDVFPDLLHGLLVSLQLTAVSSLVGVILGFLAALAVGSRSRILAAIVVVLVEVGRGTPVIVMLQLVYFGLPQAGLTLDALPAAWVALSATTAAYSSEILRGAMDAVPIRQREAARALGMSRRHVLCDVVIPQAATTAAAPLLGFLVQMFQATSLAFALSVPELLSRAYDIGTRTFHFLPALSAAGVLYAFVCIPLMHVVRRLEGKNTANRLRVAVATK
ncbi:amino acid ABC transporter permease [Schaalia sp. ZJ405]|uniref:amino acid ABC transporter permease n=1 Tax=Schaalia sp. ZJ405 TaxID=2709403 RepID=UPI0013EBEDDE|nr:amino acid ABC transporter permease [Schaalia sp. ZJ405]QPK80873.1 amino acid ABC transporter permease [Schaalia sp. ZJ405]